MNSKIAVSNNGIVSILGCVSTDQICASIPVHGGEGGREEEQYQKIKLVAMAWGKVSSMF